MQEEQARVMKTYRDALQAMCAHVEDLRLQRDALLRLAALKTTSPKIYDKVVGVVAR